MKTKKVRVLLIDNYDSFTYNLVQAFQTENVEVVVFRNDKVTTIEALEKVSNMPKKIISSKGIFDNLNKTELDWKKKTSQNPIIYKKPNRWLPTWFLAAYPNVAKSNDLSSLRLLSDK